jgi:hypothetical protein
VLPEAIVGREAGDRIRAGIDSRLKNIKISVDADAQARGGLRRLARKPTSSAASGRISAQMSATRRASEAVISLVAGRPRCPAFVVAGLAVGAFGYLPLHQFSAAKYCDLKLKTATLPPSGIPSASRRARLLRFCR